MTSCPHPRVANSAFSSTDPGMVSAYMYPAGATGAQAAPQGPAGASTSPAYSSYQPTPAQGYQVAGVGLLPFCKVPVRTPSPALVTPFCLQSVASQAPQSLPAISQPPQPGTMGYMGSPAVMGYQPYGVQVRPCGTPRQ